MLHRSELDRFWMLGAHRASWLPDQFWLFMTQWGDSAQALILLMAVFMRAPMALAITLKTWLLGACVSLLLKTFLDGARPLHLLDASALMVIGLPPSGGHAMPSGHAMAAGASAVVLLLYLVPSRPWAKLLVLLACTTVAFSRVAVGAHWPGDVLVGAGLGCLMVLLAEVWERRQPWALHLSSIRSQCFVSLLLALLVWAVFQVPLEGPGMEAARWLAFAIGAMAVVGLGQRLINKA